jgi:hypothetical protein
MNLSSCNELHMTLLDEWLLNLDITMHFYRFIVYSDMNVCPKCFWEVLVTILLTQTNQSADGCQFSNFIFSIALYLVVC